MITLEQMIAKASYVAEKAIERHGEVKAHWLVVTRKQEQMMVPAPPIPLTKQQMAVMMRQLLADLDAVQVVFVDEVWTLFAETQEQLDKVNDWYETHDSLENFPGRIEAVMFQGEAENGRLLSAQRVMQRKAGQVMLGPLQVYTPTASQGRLTGWLPARGTKQ